MTLARTLQVLADARRARVFPAAAIEVGTADAPLWSTAVGTSTFDPDSPAAAPDTVFDLASLTKVIATAAIAAELLQAGRLPLDGRVADLAPGWTGADRAAATLRDLLEHCSGLPGHRRYFTTLSGREAFETAICGEPLAYPPRTASEYSDPGFMLLGFILERLGGASLDRQFEAWRTANAPDAAVAFLPPAAWRIRTAPTEEDPWRGRLLIGEVHDENAAALGGVAGHAGLFGTAAGVGACARCWLRALRGGEAGTLRPDVARRFARRSTVPGSSRALAWDTMLPTSSCGTHLSAASIGHTGFTGTSLWIDPVQDVYVALLTNRVHPTRQGDGIQQVRRAVHDAVVDDLIARGAIRPNR